MNILRSLFKRQAKPKMKLPTFTKETYEEFMQIHRWSLKLLDEYFARLPITLLSRCPFCNQPLLYPFDPFNLNGHWWEGGINRTPPASACKHFFVLEGAFNLSDHPPPEEVGLSVEVGPDVPFVIPSHIKHAMAIAVIHKVIIAECYIGYPVGYFTTNTKHSYNRDLGGKTKAWVIRRGWTTKTGYGLDFRVHDFELAPYIAAGQVRWLDPDDPQHPVRQGRPEDCPYYNLPGHRRRQAIVGGQVFLTDSPSDDDTQPDPHGLLQAARQLKQGRRK